MDKLNAFSSSVSSRKLNITFVDECDRDYNVVQNNLIKLWLELEDENSNEERDFVVFDYEGNIVGSLSKMAKEGYTYNKNRFKEYSVELPLEINKAEANTLKSLMESIRNTLFICGTSYTNGRKSLPAILVNFPLGVGKFRQYMLDYDLKVIGQLENSTFVPTESFSILLNIDV